LSEPPHIDELPLSPGERGSIIWMRRCGGRMASRAARREPTPRGYHTGTRLAARQ